MVFHGLIMVPDDNENWEIDVNSGTESPDTTPQPEEAVDEVSDNDGTG